MQINQKGALIAVGEVVVDIWLGGVDEGEEVVAINEVVEVEVAGMCANVAVLLDELVGKMALEARFGGVGEGHGLSLIFLYEL